MNVDREIERELFVRWLGVQPDGSINPFTLNMLAAWLHRAELANEQQEALRREVRRLNNAMRRFRRKS